MQSTGVWYSYPDDGYQHLHFLESPIMPKEYMTTPPKPGKWYISESMRLTRTMGGPVEPQPVPIEMRLEEFSTEAEAKERLPYWQGQSNCHEPFIWQYLEHPPA
jgi:hypothetical protein